ncbi:MAG: helix-turn-helix domain-containing protein [Myxococcota bacterium]
MAAAAHDHQKTLLSPKDLARALGVSESSVKRWVDDGALRAMRTAGGHRRIALAEAVRFIRRSGTPVLMPELLTGAQLPSSIASISLSTPSEAAAEELWKVLCADQAPAGRALILSLYLAGWPLSAICDGPIRAAMTRIGEVWRHDKAGIYIEHRATDTCLQALAELRTLLPTEAADQLALGGAPSGDPYQLPSLMVALVLAEQGFGERNLGANTPAAVLVEAATRHRPRLVWLACSTEAKSTKDLLRELDTLSETVSPWHGEIVVGGRGLPPLGKLPERVHVLGSMGELAGFAKGLRAGAPHR